VDRSERELFWRGVATGVIAGDPKRMDKRIQEAIHKLIGRYPPTKR
jgi:hypothetical protein